MNQMPPSGPSKQIKPRASQKVYHIKKPNSRLTIPKKQWVQKPIRDYQVGDLVLVDKDLIPIKIHGKVGVRYFYIAKLDGELLPSPVRW